MGARVSVPLRPGGRTNRRAGFRVPQWVGLLDWGWAVAPEACARTSCDARHGSPRGGRDPSLTSGPQRPGIQDSVGSTNRSTLIR